MQFARTIARQTWVALEKWKDYIEHLEDKLQGQFDDVYTSQRSYHETALAKVGDLETRLRELELAQAYPNAADLGVAIEEAIKMVAYLEAPEDRDEAEKVLQELVRYAGRSGMLEEEIDGES